MPRISIDWKKELSNPLTFNYYVSRIFIDQQKQL